MGNHTENMRGIVETLKASGRERREFEKGRLKAEHQRREDFGSFLGDVRNRIQEIQEDTKGIMKDARGFLNDFRTTFKKEVQGDIKGGAKVWQNYKKGRKAE